MEPNLGHIRLFSSRIHALYPKKGEPNWIADVRKEWWLDIYNTGILDPGVQTINMCNVIYFDEKENKNNVAISDLVSHK